jgi:hypothetical protein
VSGHIIPGAGGEIQFAKRIEAEHRAAIGAARTAIEHAFECGRLLIEAKEQVGHGGWLAWVEGHLSFGARQAAKYMRLHRHRGHLANRTCGSDLGVNAAVGLLATPKEHAGAGDEVEALMRVWDEAEPAAHEWFLLAVELVGVSRDMPEFLADIDLATLRRMVTQKRLREPSR